MDLSDFTKCRHELKRSLLVITGSKGSLACGYLNVSYAAERLGLHPGMTGEEALGRMK